MKYINKSKQNIKQYIFIRFNNYGEPPTLGRTFDTSVRRLIGYRFYPLLKACAYHAFIPSSDDQD